MAGRAKSKQPNNNGKVRIADNGYKFPEQLPIGELLIDSFKNEWVLGKAIARGGFGEIYEARPSLIKSNLPIKKNKDYEYVVKVDNFVGPLFCEMNFYIRVAKHDFISKWMSDKGLKFLGIPSFIATGTHTKPESTKHGRTATKDPTRYRFLVMPRFGSDLQKVLDSNKLKLPLKAAYTIGIKVLDILEYIHSRGYIHADIKASNLLLSFKKGVEESVVHDEIWLVDFGLVEKYLQGDNLTHKPYEEDARRANNGTIEFTSRDAHIGCFSRKGDIEILAYNLLSWLSGGRLPWMHNLADKTLVKNLKNNYMDRLDDLLKYAFQSGTSETVTSANKRQKTAGSSNKLVIPDGISEFFRQTIKMKYSDKPNYKQLKSILEKAIVSSGERFDGTFYLRECDKNSINKSRISPLKRRLSSAKSLNESTNQSTDVSVIFDEDTDEEIVDLTGPAKRPRRESTNSVNTRKSPIVLNAKVASNGRSKNGVNGRSTANGKANGKSTPTSDRLVNGYSKSPDALKLDSPDDLDDSIEKQRRRNPSRKVKHSVALNENNKLVNNEQHELLRNGLQSPIRTPIKNGRTPQKDGRIKNSKSKSAMTTLNKSENQIVVNGKVWNNPTPAMLELLNRMQSAESKHK